MKLVNQQVIKNTNMKRLYTSIYSSPGISRAHLAKQTKLSKTTVSTLVDELIEREFIVDSGIGESDSIGRKPNCLQVRMNSYYIVVMNWHENTVEAYLVDIAGTSVFHEARKLSEDENHVACSCSCFRESILEHCAPDRILGICVVMSAMIDASSNEVYSTTLNLPSMESTQIIKSLKTAFPGYPVDLLNDTACYSYAEKVYGNIKEKNFAFLNFGRGIGATLFTEGSMLGTASGSFTQFGHYSRSGMYLRKSWMSGGYDLGTGSEKQDPGIRTDSILKRTFRNHLLRSGKGCHFPRSNRSCHGKGDGMGAVHRPE